ncbi:MAG: ATP-binding protein [Polyangiaceae bacterium]
MDEDVLATDSRASVQSRTTRLVAITAVGWFFFAARSALLGSYLFSAVAAAGCALTAVVYLGMRARPAWLRPLTHANAAVATVFIVACCALSGQSRSPALPYLLCVPLSVGYLLGVRMSMLWTFICVLAAIVNDILTRLVPIKATYGDTMFDGTLAVLVLLAVVVLLVTVQDRLRAAHIQALDEQKRTILTLNHDLAQKSEEADQARDRAIAASRAKGDFVATLSHEIRTPLNGVLGMASLLQDHELPPDQRELVRTIRTSGDALLGLLNELLDFSKIEAGALELESAPFDLKDTLQETFDLMGITASAKRLTLSSKVEAGAVTRLIGDAGRVRQILVNLVSNAIKFTEQGFIEIGVSTTSQGESGAVAVHLTVRDSGVGIPPDRIGTLFEPFKQADSSTTRRFGGTGLGLAICRRLAIAMGGDTWVESTLGRGSTFHVTLGLRRAPESRDSRRSSMRGQVPLPGMRFEEGEAPSVLVAEDNPVNQQVIKLMLVRCGVQPVLAGNGLEALQHLRARDYDLVLMDVRMPEMDGLDATRVLRREIPEGRQPIVVAMTANVQVEDRKACEEAGMDDFVPKPIHPRDLARVLEKAAKRRAERAGVKGTRESVASP